MENRFHKLERDSKLRLLKTHSHTSYRQDYEQDFSLVGPGITGENAGLYVAV